MGKMKLQTTNHLQEKGDKFDQFASFIQVMQSFTTPVRDPRTLYAPRPLSGYPRQMPTQNRFRFRPKYTGCSFVGTPRILEQTVRKTSNEVLSLCFVDERL